MQNTLRAAGIPQAVRDLVPGILDTCKECRRWKPPAAETQVAMRISAKFNEHVECDLLFYRTFIVFHLIDRCIRWHAGDEA